MERVCHLTNKIYRGILCILSHERITYLAIRGLDQVPVGAFSLQYGIVLSTSLLAWITVEGRIPCTFTNFIATPELSGPFYISPGIYHTQIMEFLLEKIYQLSALLSVSNIFLIVILFRSSPFILHHCFLDPEWTFREHLSRALPTNMIFSLLRSIPSQCLIRDNSAELMLELIIMWLQVSC